MIKIVEVLDCVKFVVSLLVWPSALVTLLFIAILSFKKTQFLESLPLLFGLLNTAFIWGCMSAAEIGYFDSVINNNMQILDGKRYGLRDLTIRVFLLNVVYLEPITLFLYTWRFWEVICEEHHNRFLKSFYKWFALVSICILPLAFYAVLIAQVIEQGKYIEYSLKGKFKLAQLHYKKARKLLSVIGYFSLTCNLISCWIMGIMLNKFY